MSLGSQELNRLALALGGQGGLDAFINAVPGIGAAGRVDSNDLRIFDNVSGLMVANLYGTSNIARLAIGRSGYGGKFALVDYAGSNAHFSVDATASPIEVGIAKSTDELGFFDVAPVVRASAYTQTYATASKTHAAPTATSLTDSSGGSSSSTLAVISALIGGVGLNSPSTTDVNTALAGIANSIASLATRVNALIADVANVKQVVNSIIDDHQAYGLLA